MSKRFKEIRVFCGNGMIGDTSVHAVEFVYAEHIIRNMLFKFNTPGLRFSRSRSKELVLEPQNANDFINALRKTEVGSINAGATIYDMASLLAQDYSRNSSGLLYIKDFDNTLPIDILVEVMSEKYFNVFKDADKIAEFIGDCMKAIQTGSCENQELNK